MKLHITKIVPFLFLPIVLGSCGSSRGKQQKPDAEFMGYIENTQVNVTTRMPGRIAAIYVDEGDTLKQGDTVAQLDTREIRNKLAALLSKLENVNINKKRVEHLYKAGAVSEQKLDEISTGYEMLRDNIRALKIRIEDMTIRAPMDGIVTAKVLEVNQMMPPGMPVVIEADPQGTWARFSIPETFLDKINLGDVFTLGSNMGTVKFKAKVVRILPMANFATRTPTTTRDRHDVQTFSVKMRILDDLSKCKPGMSVYLHLNSSK